MRRAFFTTTTARKLALSTISATVLFSQISESEGGKDEKTGTIIPRHIYIK